MGNWLCKYCKAYFDFEQPYQKASHSRWCTENPKHKQYKDELSNRTIKYNKKRKPTNQFISGNMDGHSPSTIEKIKQLSTGRNHTDETKHLCRIKALASNHRRLRRKTIMYNGIMMDSTWEVELAKRLDDLNIKWERPKPIKWVDENGLSHNYFPDFYIPEMDVYLDPKNKHAYNVQKKKIDILNKTYNNIIWLTSLDEIKNWPSSSAE